MMADVRMITVEPHRTPLLLAMIRQIIFWACLVGAAGLSRIWFGGAWIIDLTVLFAVVLSTIMVGLRASGANVSMTRDELRRWVDAGMPDDIREWREGNRC